MAEARHLAAYVEQSGGAGPLTPPFSIVIPTFRRPAALRECLTALLRLEYPARRYEIVVVDDGDDDETEHVIRRISAEDIEISLARQRQKGAAAARNRGARAASGELVVFLDDDIIVASDHLRKHVRAREAHGDALVNGAWEFSPGVASQLAGTPFGRFRLDLERYFQEDAAGMPLEDGSLVMRLLGTWDLALRRELFWDLGGFDERFPVAGAEDQDFSLRARLAGHLLILDPSIRCLHNDDRLTLSAYCAREERSARTMPYMAAKHPDQFAESRYVVENRRMSVRDGSGVLAKKVIKAVLATSISLAFLHRVVGVLERVRAPDPLLRRLYTLLLGLHLFRGYRSAL